MTVELETLLSPEIYARLKDEAERRSIVLDDLVRDALESFVHTLDDEDIENPSDEVILDDIRSGFDAIKTGQTYPASEMMERLQGRINEKHQDELEEYLLRELYAKFGLAYYLSECIHAGFMNFYAVTNHTITKARYDEKFIHAKNMTLGQLATIVRVNLPLDLNNEIDLAIEKRNHLAHGFWFENSHKLSNPQTVIDLIQELSNLADLFSLINMRLDQILEIRYIELGGTSESLEKILIEVIKGEDIEYPTTHRKPLTKASVKITQVYDVIIESKGKTLVFETDEGELLEFCDVGLGWSYQLKTDHIWRPNEKFKEFLPMTLNPRPKIDKIWNYQFELPKRCVLIVSLKDGEKIFSWHIS